MSLLLDLLYLCLIAAAFPWLVYSAIRFGKYREGLLQKLLGLVPRRSSNRRCIWLHAVSVGEVKLLGPLIGRIERELPGWECVVSTTTRTGYALATQLLAPRTVFYCPLDFSWAVREAMRRVRPDLLVLAELELWPNLIHAAKQQGAKVAVINARMSDNSFRGYRRLRWLASRLLRQFDLVAAQTDEYAQRFVELGAREAAVCVSGSLKFDGAETNRQNPTTRRLAQLAAIREDDVAFLAGSTQEGEEALAIDAFQLLIAAHPHLRLILVPRHPERFESVAEHLDRSGLRWQRRSRLETDGANPAARILLVDTIGELGAWWGTARIAFVGGSMDRQRGGQNMLEPAAYGAAVSFGPHTANFRDVVAMLLARNAAQVIRNFDELTTFVRRCLEEPRYASGLGQRARQCVQENLGACETTVERLLSIIDERRLMRVGKKRAA